ncbi:MAG: hypothetical protein AAF512_05935 [Pseudomonadota bacterium]
MNERHYWWVTAGRGYDWRWSDFFSEPALPEAYHWGGTWIRSALSFKRIEKMCKGDVIAAYEAGTGIVGLTVLAVGGYRNQLDSPYNAFALDTQHKVWLEQAVPFATIRFLPNAMDTIEFVKVKRGTVFAVSPPGFAQIVTALVAANPAQAEEIEIFLQRRT